MASSETGIIFLVDAFPIYAERQKAISRKAEGEVSRKCSKGEKIQKKKRKETTKHWAKSRERQNKEAMKLTE